MDRINLAGYLSDEEDIKSWHIVRDHYGPEYSNSAVIADLVRKKANDISGKRTNRQVTERMLEAVERLDSRMRRVEEKLGIDTDV